MFISSLRSKHPELSNSLTIKLDHTLNRTRNLEVTRREDNAPAHDAEAHLEEHMRLAVQDDREVTHDIPEPDIQEDA